MTQHITILSADLETPVGLYLKVRDLYPCSALLESLGLPYIAKLHVAYRR